MSAGPRTRAAIAHLHAIAAARSEPTNAQVLAVLEVLGWPDDREGSAHVEEDGYEVTPAGHYWETATDVARAVLGGTP